MNIVFMGTPDFAACVLKALVEAGHTITGVYTQPDRPKGRSGEPVWSPVKEYALSMGFDVYQPVKIKTPEEVAVLRTIPADVFVVAAFGQFLSEEILNMPKFGCINVHGSLLPKLRGAAPIQRAIANGDKTTGVTVMQMDKGMDSGDIITAAYLPIEDDDNEITMYDKLAKLGAKLLCDTLPLIEAGTVTPIKQDESEVTFAPMLRKEEGLIDFSVSARLIDCKVRGFLVWPCAYTYLDGKVLKVLKSKPVDEPAGAPLLNPGEVFITKKQFFVKTKDGYLELLEVQPEGKKRMGAIDFARGVRLETGKKLGV